MDGTPRLPVSSPQHNTLPGPRSSNPSTHITESSLIQYNSTLTPQIILSSIIPAYTYLAGIRDIILQDVITSNIHLDAQAGKIYGPGLQFVKESVNGHWKKLPAPLRAQNFNIRPPFT